MQIKTIEDVPLYDTSLRLLKLLSFLLEHNWRRYFSLITYFMINMGQFLDIYFSTQPIDVVVLRTHVVVLICIALLRSVSLCINRLKYEKFMDNLRLLYIELMESEDETIRNMLQETTKFSRFMANANLFIGFCGCIGFTTYPLFAPSRVLPFGTYIPIIDKYKSPFYELFYVYQVLITPIGLFMYLPFTNLIVGFVLFAILMCKVMQHKLKNLKGVTNETAIEVIVWCIKYQLQLIRYVDTLNNFISYIFLVEFLASGTMLCAMLFVLVIVESVAQMVTVSIYILMVLSQCFVMYYFANDLYDQSLLVANAAYESDWFECDVPTQKTLKLFILRAQKPCALMVGNVYHMNLALFQSLLNATYSYFTLLKRFYG